MKNRKMMIALLLLVAMMATLFTGCGKKIDVDEAANLAASLICDGFGALRG
jgi:hypothetical protein